MTFRPRLVKSMIRTIQTATDTSQVITTSHSGKTSVQKPRNTVLVTGGSGFVGQHIVKLLQEKSPTVDEIRVFDTKPYTNKLGHKGDKTFKSIVGDINDRTCLEDAMRGVTSVIHAAGVISFNMFPDVKAMEKVNVQGTKTIIDACIETDVKHLVYCSSIDVVIGYKEIICGDEGSTNTPKKYMFRGYPETKQKAEVLVKDAHGAKLKSGDKLATISLRPNVMYGEEDPYYITNAYKTARKNKGVLQRVGDGSAKFQQAYVGNAAWAHITALETLAASPDVGGKGYFITDDSPIQNCFDMMSPFLEAHGFSLSTKTMSYKLAYIGLYSLEWVLWFMKPLLRLNPQISLASLIYLNTTIYFSSLNARKCLNYSPIYPYEEALSRSVKYYGNLKI